MTESTSTTVFIDVVLPLNIPKLYTYRVPSEMESEIFVGSRVIVQFGAKRILTGIIFNIHHRPPGGYEAKSILEVLDNQALINPFQFQLFQWMADYYLCTLGEVMNAAVPAGFKLSSSSRIQVNPDFLDSADYSYSKKELQLMEALTTRESLSYEEAAQVLQTKNINAVIKSLIGKRRILLFEEVREKYSPKVVQKVRLHSHYNSQEILKEAFDELEKKPRQLELLIRYMQMVPVQTRMEANAKGIDKKELLTAEGSLSSLKTLIKKNIFEEFTIVSPRYESSLEIISTVTSLSPVQQAAKTEISKLFESKDVALLHGITGSGKTEVYIELIKDALAGGSQVLYLLPEIALTTQIVSRLKKVFGNRMGVYHSKFSDNERVDIWRGLASGHLSFIIGVRSSIFLPFDNLGLIIIDEEHETSYKQYEQAPRYHARESAIMLARFHHAKTLLGSATPSIESYHHALEGKWGLVQLLQRYGEAHLPQLSITDMKIERRNRTVRNDFSSTLIEAIKTTKNNGMQTILFQNRRGYAPILTCLDCAFIPKCSNCAVSLTYHMHRHKLSCHYCGFKEAVPKQCPDCGSSRLKTQGFGTEKIEDDLKLFFPDLQIERMDLDTTRKKNSYQEMIENFETGKTDILVGTQMVSKGFDFGKVNLVGILDADRMIHFPDFRSYERAFQMIQQVSGRAGRRSEPGKVVIQSSNPLHPVLLKLLENDYVGMFQMELQERKKFNYPPFSRLIKIICRNVNESLASALAVKVSDQLLKQLGSARVLGPEPSLIPRIRNYYIYEILIKIEKGKMDLQKVKQMIRQEIAPVLHLKEHANSVVVVDVDPV